MHVQKQKQAKNRMISEYPSLRQAEKKTEHDLRTFCPSSLLQRTQQLSQSILISSGF